jgi:prolyl-tRNA synthetase
MAEKNENEVKLGLRFSKNNLSGWYNDLVLKAGLADFSSVKGFMFIKPYGYAIWENMQKVLDSKFKETGHTNAYAPAVIPERLLKKEKEHVEGFAPEGFYITETGSGKLNEKLVLRPTSETIICDFYSKWIRSWRDLPVLWNYWNSVFRAEIKMTKLFIRTCEFLWQEGHTVHATKKEADEEVMRILKIYRDLIENYLAVPVLIGKKSEKEKFAGALYTATLEALMPDGKALQMGTSHNLGQNFSKPFGITFLDKDRKRKYAWQTSWGVSTRMIGAIVMTHGDNKGLVLPPQIAPVQLVIVPIIFEKKKKRVLEKSVGIFNKLKGEFRAELDDREEYTPGWKFNEWELKGVPVRIEIGPKDIDKKQVVLVRRDTGEKKTVRERELEKTLKTELESIQKELFRKAKTFLEKNTASVKNFRELKKAIKNRKMAKTFWCGKPECENKIQEETTATIRLIPFDSRASGKCVCCRNRAKEVVYISRAY